MKPLRWFWSKLDLAPWWVHAMFCIGLGAGLAWNAWNEQRILAFGFWMLFLGATIAQALYTPLVNKANALIDSYKLMLAESRDLNQQQHETLMRVRPLLERAAERAGK